MKIRFLIGLLFLLCLCLSVSVCDGIDDDESQPIQLQDASNLQPETQEIVENTQVKSENTQTQQQVFDDEEFVGFDTLPKKNEKEKLIKQINEQQEKMNIPIPVERDNYYLEIGFIALIILYLANFYVGKNQNYNIAIKWTDTARKVFDFQFTKLIGDPSTNGILKEAHHLYRLKATGRANCLGLQANLSLVKRHDLISVIMGLFSPSQDLMTITILMPETVEPFVLGLVKTKHEKKFRKDNADMAFTHTTESSSLPGLSFLSEADEAKELLTREIKDTLKTLDKEFISLHISDQAVVSQKYRKTVELVFVIPDDPEKLMKLLKMSLFLVDRLAVMKLSPSGKNKTEKNRQKQIEEKLKQAHVERQELAQQKKAEKLALEKQSWDKLSPEEQQKREEKLYKKELKKRQQKQRVIIG